MKSTKENLKFILDKLGQAWVVIKKGLKKIWNFFSGLIFKNNKKEEDYPKSDQPRNKSTNIPPGNKKEAALKLSTHEFMKKIMPDFEQLRVDQAYSLLCEDRIPNDSYAFCFVTNNTERYYINLTRQEDVQSLECLFKDLYNNEKYQIPNFHQYFQLPVIRLIAGANGAQHTSTLDNQDIAKIVYKKLEDSLARSKVFTLNVSTDGNQGGAGHTVYISGYLDDKKVLHLKCFNQTSQRSDQDWCSQYENIMEQISTYFKETCNIGDISIEGIEMGAFPLYKGIFASCMETGFFLYSAGFGQEKDNIESMKYLFDHSKDFFIDLQLFAAIRYKLGIAYSEFIRNFTGESIAFYDGLDGGANLLQNEGVLPIEGKDPYQSIISKFKDRDKYVLTYPKNKPYPNTKKK